MPSIVSATVIELVDGIEHDFAAMLRPGAYDGLRKGLLTIADRIDPDGALGAGDVPAPVQRARRQRAGR